jgi:WD40 repeat protein
VIRILYSIAGDNIRVTNCNDDSLITTLTGHTNYILCLIIDDGKLCSGSMDKTIKVWNCSTDNTLLKTLTKHTEHTGSAMCLTINDGKLYSDALVV